MCVIFSTYRRLVVRSYFYRLNGIKENHREENTQREMEKKKREPEKVDQCYSKFDTLRFKWKKILFMGFFDSVLVSFIYLGVYIFHILFIINSCSFDHPMPTTHLAGCCCFYFCWCCCYLTKKLQCEQTVSSGSTCSDWILRSLFRFLYYFPFLFFILWHFCDSSLKQSFYFSTRFNWLLSKLHENYSLINHTRLLINLKDYRLQFTRIIH